MVNMINRCTNKDDRSRFYLHCLSSLSSLNGDTSGACSSLCFFLLNPTCYKRHFFHVKWCATHIGLARARARAIAKMFSDNTDYVNFHVDMLCLKHCKNQYADWVQDAVYWGSKKLQKKPKNPPRADNARGEFLYNTTHSLRLILPPTPCFV